MAIAPLEADYLHYYEMEQTEAMTLYFSGSYHPIVVGEILGPCSERQCIESCTSLAGAHTRLCG